MRPKRDSKYRRIWEKAFGPIPKDNQGRSYEIHHIDGNSDNNSLDNLLCVSIEEHHRIHLQQKEYNAAHLIAERMGLNSTGWKHSEETKKKMSEVKKGKPGVKRSEETREKMRVKKLGNTNAKGKLGWRKIKNQVT